MAEHGGQSDGSAALTHKHSHHHHEAGIDFTKRNKDHWDKSASTYADEPWQKDMINKTHAFLLSHLTWLGVDFIDPSKAFEASDNSHQVRVLDYACGPGTITNILLGHATEFLGVDLSENMVNEYNKRFTSTSNDGKSKVNAKAVVGDLIAPDGPTDSTFPSEYFGFDLAVVGFGFHHFQDLKRATERLVSRLKPGGVFMIADFVHHDEVASHAQHTIAHNGFGEGKVHQIFGEAGLTDIGFLQLPEGVTMIPRGGEGKQHYRDIFLAKGKKSGAPKREL